MATHLTSRQLIFIIVVGFLLLLALAFSDPGFANATTPPPEWDRSSIEVTGTCLADGTAQFSVTNTGQAMAGPSTWRLYEDDVLITEGGFQLLAGASEIFEYGPRWNSAIRLEVDQRPGHPGASAPRVTLICQQPTAVKVSTFSAQPALTDLRALGRLCLALFRP